MSIRIKFSPDLYIYTDNERSAEVEGKTVDECLARLAEIFPDLKRVLYGADGELSGIINVYIKGEDSEPWDLFRPVKDGDELTIAPGGG